jgi:hypothetical protein
MGSTILKQTDSPTAQMSNYYYYYYYYYNSSSTAVAATTTITFITISILVHIC